MVVYHISLIAPSGPTPGLLQRAFVRLGGMGWVGTDLALALSGYLAVGSRRRAAGGFAWLGRRALRILPAFAVFLFAYLEVLPALLEATGAAPERLAGLRTAQANRAWIWGMATNVLMVLGRRTGAALEPLLTLAVLAQLTVIAALVLSGARSRRTLLGLAAIVASGWALRVAWLDADVYRAYSFPLTRCDAFSAGIAAAWLLADPRYGSWLRRRRGPILAAGFALLLVAIGITRGLCVQTRTTALVGYPAVGAFAGALVLALAQVERVAPWVRRLAPAGAAAYAMYLVKLPVILAVHDLLLRWSGPPDGGVGLAALTAVGLAVTAAAGALLHLVAERPLLRAGALLAREPGPVPGGRS